MNARQIAAIIVIALLPVPGIAQNTIDLAGKWVVDQGRMQEIDPAWDGFLTRDMWISTSAPAGGLFRVARSIDTDEIRSGRNEDTYDPSGGPTTIYVGGSAASASAHWDDDRLVARIFVPDSELSFTRIFYREGPWLVIEEQGRPGIRWTRTYFVRS